MADEHRLLSTRTKAFADIRVALASCGFHWKGEKHYLLFVHRKFYLRLEDCDGEWVTAHVSPKSDRWANSRHFEFRIPFVDHCGTIRYPNRRKPTPLSKIKWWVKIHVKRVRDLTKRIPKLYFNQGLRIHL